MTGPTTPRYAARVLLVDPTDRLLLWHASPGDTEHWAPPGGGLLPGETTREAATRELREEAGITGLVLGRPVWTWRHRYRQSGVLIDQHDTIYAVGHAGKVRLGPGAAADGIRDVRWWPVGELAHCRAEVWPSRLARLAPGLLRDDLDPATPIDLGTTS